MVKASKVTLLKALSQISRRPFKIENRDIGIMTPIEALQEDIYVLLNSNDLFFTSDDLYGSKVKVKPLKVSNISKTVQEREMVSISK